MKNVLRMVGRIFGCARGHDSGTRLAHSHLTSCEARRAMLKFDCLVQTYLDYMIPPQLWQGHF